MTKENMNIVLRNAETEKMIRETQLINLKPVAFGVAALLLVIYLITNDAFALPKQKLNNIVDDYNNEIIVDMNNLVGEVK